MHPLISLFHRQRIHSHQTIRVQVRLCFSCDGGSTSPSAPRQIFLTLPPHFTNRTPAVEPWCKYYIPSEPGQECGPG